MRGIALPAIVLVLSACGGGGGGGGGTGGPPPALDVVASVTPAHRALDIPLDVEVAVSFETAMDDAPLTGGALILALAGTNQPVDASIVVSPSRTSVVLSPLQELLPNRDYQVRLSPLARRADGREIRRPWFSNFRTGGIAPPPPPPPPVQTGTSSPTGSLTTGRSGHAAAVLQDGRVAVFGGYSTSAAVTASIEVYEPATGMWTAGSPLGTARAQCSATVLVDGRVLVAGGETASSTDVGLGTFEIWSPVAGAVVATGNLAERRTRHRAVLLGDGRVLIAGGSRTDGTGQPNFSRATAEIFDPGTGVSSAISSMGVTRAGHQATLLADGRVLMTGGHGTNAVAEVFNPVNGTFVVAGTMTTPRRDHTATLLVDGSVLVAGGGAASSERWIPAQNAFFAMQNLGDVRSFATAVRIANGRVMVAGGEKPSAGGAVYLSTMDFFEVSIGAFLFPDIKTSVPRSGHTASLLSSGDVLLVGGKNPILAVPAVRTCDLVHPQ